MQTKQRDVRRSVSIIVSRGWLQLRFSYGGKLKWTPKIGQVAKL
jgi:hypothetical protein